MTDDREPFREARAAGLKARQERRLENATYTAAEVKVLTETASKVGYALGRKDAAMEIRLQIAAPRTDPPESPKLSDKPQARSKRYPHAHVCVTCSPDGREPGPGCINCRQTGWDQTPCMAEGHKPQCPHGCCSDLPPDSRAVREALEANECLCDVDGAAFISAQCPHHGART